MINFTSRISYYLSSRPTDMRKGKEGLACVVREVFGRDPLSYNEAFIFYSKDYRKVKILHYDINGYVVYAKWFDDGKLLKPEFTKAQECHSITREAMILLMSTAVQTKILI